MKLQRGSSIAREVDRWMTTGSSTLGKELPLGLSKNQQGQSNRTESRQRAADGEDPLSLAYLLTWKARLYFLAIETEGEKCVG